MHTKVKFWAWYLLNGAGVSAATTAMETGGAVEKIEENGYGSCNAVSALTTYSETLQENNSCQVIYVHYMDCIVIH